MHVHFDRVSHKHIGLGIQPEHYTLFKGGLASSFHSVFGGKMTEETISAWEELVDLVSEGLIETETTLYDRKSDISGSWKGARTF